jgi:exopolysaccharide biosynthesis polyprenyl glycosylphosphotransferase
MLFFIEKTLLFYFAAHFRKIGKNRKRVLIIGTGPRTDNFIDIVNDHFSWGLDIIGIISGQPELIGKDFHGKKILDDYSDFDSILKKYNPEEVIITLSINKFREIRNILEECEIQGVQVRINSDFLGKITKNMRIDNVFGLNLVSFTLIQQKDFELFIKRLLDIVISFFALIILSPLALTISILILIQDGFPVHYKWRVVGLNRKPILSWKFRTMVKNADIIKKELLKNNEMNGPVFKMTNDPRILPIGKFLRKFSLDELPQLYSVLKGDLSLVGPRPPLIYEFNEFDNWHRRKLSVKPGITCLWQISGRNNINNFDEWAKLDLEYIDNWSLWLDLKILFKTIPVVVLGKGAK